MLPTTYHGPGILEGPGGHRWSPSFTWTGAYVTSVSSDPISAGPLTGAYHYDDDRLAGVCAQVATPCYDTSDLGSKNVSELQGSRRHRNFMEACER